MPEPVTATVSELDESRVRLAVVVDADEVQRRVERRARALAGQLKLPGFRRGKVPVPLVIQRVGRESILEEAVSETLPQWYASAIDVSGITPVGDPDLDLGALPAQGEALEFTIEIGVLPQAVLGSYEGIEAPRREPAVADEQIEAEVQGMRERLARLETADRPAADGDFVVIDYAGSIASDGEAQDEGAESEWEPFAGGEGRDQLVELGSGNLIPGFEDGLRGASAGDERTVRVRFPDDYGAEQLAGRDASFAVTVKEVKQKELPELDEDFAIDAGFDDIGELRDDIRRRLLEIDEARVQAEFREAALDAAVAEATVPVTPELARARAKEMWERTLHSLSHQGISREAYLQITGRDEDEVVAGLEGDAEKALRREAVLNAVVAAEGIEPSDEEILDALTPIAQREGVEPAVLMADLEKAGRLDDVREEVAVRKAIDRIAEGAKPIAPAQAQAREQLWTPGKGEGAGELWTPSGPGKAG